MNKDLSIMTSAVCGGNEDDAVTVGLEKAEVLLYCKQRLVKKR